MNRTFGISGFWLKIAAIIAMTCNHVSRVFGSSMPWEAEFAFYAVGGMTFPIMAFLLTEGYLHTSDLRNYALRLGAFAVVAQIPCSLLFGAVGNVLFTLLIGLGVLWAHDRIEDRSVFICVLIGAAALSIPLDWGFVGVLAIWLFYELRDRRHRGITTTMSVLFIYVILTIIITTASDPNYALMAEDVGYAAVGFGAATLLLCAYNGQRGPSMKWFFYAYYPLHLFIIWGIKALV